MKTFFSVLIFSLYFVIQNPSPVLAEADINSAFKSYQNNDFEAAKKEIEDALKAQPGNSYLIYNLGLTEYKLGNPGLAIGLWHKALSINSGLYEAKAALNYAISQLSNKPPAPTGVSSWDWVQGFITKYVSFHFVWPIFLIVFFFFCRLLFRFLAARKKAAHSDEPMPSISLALLNFFFLAVLLGAISAVCLYDLNLVRGVAIIKSLEIKTGPSSDNATLFDIPEGAEVVLRDKKNDWYKIEDSLGRSGWADAKNIFVTTEKNL